MKQTNESVKPEVLVQVKKLNVVHEFKYLGIIVESLLINVNSVKFNFRFIRNYWTKDENEPFGYI